MDKPCKLLSLETHAMPRIVALLEEALAEAKAGRVSRLFLYTEDERGNRVRSNDGFSDSELIFALELIKRRTLERYE